MRTIRPGSKLGHAKERSMDTANWQETYNGGTPAAEEAIFLKLAGQMLDIQEANRKSIRARTCRPYVTRQDDHRRDGRGFGGRCGVSGRTPGRALPSGCKVAHGRPIFECESVRTTRQQSRHARRRAQNLARLSGRAARSGQARIARRARFSHDGIQRECTTMARPLVSLDRRDRMRRP